jgi:hypothetical protein
VIVRFFDIRNIVDHHCLNFLSIVTFGKVKNVEKREIVKCLFEQLLYFSKCCCIVCCT